MYNHNKLRVLRQKMQWTQGHAASKIGIQQSYLSKLENGQAIPSNDILVSIAEVYSVSFEEIAPQITNHIHEIPKKTSPLKFNMGVVSIISFFIFIGGSLYSISIFGLYQSNTAYTYEISANDANNSKAPVYFVTDEYQGEKYQLPMKKSTANYQLIGERDITPFINRALSFAGVVLVLLGIALLGIGLFRRRQL